MKKKFNWLGWSLVALYVLILIILFIICLHTENEFFKFITALWRVLILPISIVTILNTRLDTIPEQKAKVKVVSKGVMRSVEPAGDMVDVVYKKAASFILPDNTILTFPLNPEIYNSISVNDEGTLVYKQRTSKSQIYFVRFEPDSKPSELHQQDTMSQRKDDYK